MNIAGNLQRKLRGACSELAEKLAANAEQPLETCKHASQAYTISSQSRKEIAFLLVFRFRCSASCCQLCCERFQFFRYYVTIVNGIVDLYMVLRSIYLLFDVLFSRCVLSLQVIALLSTLLTALPV